MEDEINNLKKHIKKISNDNKKLKYRNKLECEVNIELARRLNNMKSVNKNVIENVEVMKEKISEQISSSITIINEIKVEVHNKLSLNSSK